MSNFLYFLYFLKISDWGRLRSHFNFTLKKYQLGRWRLFWDVVGCALKYGISFHEYFYYDFAGKTAAQRAEYASMGFMYRYQKRMNPPGKREMLADKHKFDRAFAEFMHRGIMNPLTATTEEVADFIRGKDKVVLKRSTGGGGKNVKIVAVEGTAEESAKAIQTDAVANRFDLMEEFIHQHPALQELSPNSLNTVRFITQRKDDGTVEVIGASLRMGITKNTDNLSSGGITCKINLDTGKLDSLGYSFDITQPLCEAHPVSGVKLVGFQIPCWDEVKSMCLQAAAKYADNKCIGWDVAIKSDGPLLIEGNHDWGARVWQMPAGKGMKRLLEKYL
jgi:hypothetical protein